MQRQSLGSPGSKLHSGGVLAGGAKEDNNNLRVEDQKRKDLPPSLAAAGGDDEVRKSLKPQKSPARATETFIHLIPILTLVCFLILYLSSHDPSQKDLAQFNGFNSLSKLIDSKEIDDIGRFLEVDKGDVLAIRSQRNLQEIDKSSPEQRVHRKIADF